MFNKKLKIKISELEKKLYDANEKLKEQQKEIKSYKFQIDNPPKYKTGDNISGLLVINRRITEPDFLKMATDHTVVNLIMLGITSIDTTEKLKEYLAENYSPYWEYELINTATGERVKRKESELCGQD